MSTPNFISQNDFPLMIIDDSDYFVPVCPVCGSPLDNFSNGDTCDWYCYSCDCHINDVSDCEYMYDDLSFSNDADWINQDIQRFADSLTFFDIELISGYYTGIQAIVTSKIEGYDSFYRSDNLADYDPHNMDNDDCHYYYDMCRSKAIRAYDSETRKVQKFLRKLTDWGMKQLQLIGIYSNGEAAYHYA